ncbi:hypothetical protein KDC22_13070 [Paenibacillus tritici]|uniref:hypothetical protein n=1 Tax=Paenibacillus tritici TaxID=1873425 RepID=UPI001BAA2271|nr:hypothetical protein [Paenibacillus tritici]QUL57311.1 hypothetical protein KDC22_13070 [Paenibacillus tritici]
MSVEDQLKRDFDFYKQTAIVPEQLDRRLSASFAQYYSQEIASGSKRPVRGTVRIALVLCGLMLFGGVVYGAERLWAISYGSTGIEVNVHQGIIETAAFGNKTRQVIEEIQSQLAVNESAILYITEPNVGHSLRMINRPQVFTDIESWKKIMEPITGTLAVPGRLPEGYHFSEGRSDSTVGITDGSWVKKYTNVLTKRLQPGEHYAWIKSFNVPNLLAGTVSPELVYQGPKGEEDAITVSYSPLGPESQLQSDVGADSTVKQLKVGSVKALYVVSRQAYEASSTGYYAYIRWIELRENEDKNILHQVSTESKDVSRETLLTIAKGLR